MGMLIMLKEGKIQFKIDIDSKGTDEIESTISLIEVEVDKIGEFYVACFGT